MSNWVEIGKNIIFEEIQGLKKVYESLGESFRDAVDLILKHAGKTVVTGIGKSGHIAQKIVSTFNSTGTRAVFLHPSEAMHGDLGVYMPGDPTILISKSGSTEELVRLIPILKSFNSPLIALVGNASSPIAQKADIVLDGSVLKEADTFGFVPTSSALVALSLGDALACTLMRARDFQKNDFLRFHPAGQLGRNLSLRVDDVMHTLPQVAIISPEDNLRRVVIAMTEKPLGAAFVFDGSTFLGIITDGDIRRVLRECQTIEAVKAGEFMTKSPVFVYSDLSLEEAVHLMEDRPAQIYVLPVMDRKSGACSGLLRLHDIYQSQNG